MADDFELDASFRVDGPAPAAGPGDSVRRLTAEVPSTAMGDEARVWAVATAHFDHVKPGDRLHVDPSDPYVVSNRLFEAGLLVLEEAEQDEQDEPDAEAEAEVEPPVVVRVPVPEGAALKDMVTHVEPDEPAAPGEPDPAEAEPEQ